MTQKRTGRGSRQCFDGIKYIRHNSECGVFKILQDQKKLDIDSIYFQPSQADFLFVMGNLIHDDAVVRAKIYCIFAECKYVFSPLK